MEAPKMNTRKLIGNNGVGKDQKHSQSQEIYNWLPLQLALLPQFASDTNYYQTLVYNWNEWIHFHSNQTFESPLFKYSSMLNEKSVRWLVLSVQTTVQSWWCARSNHDNLFYWNHDPLHFWIRQESSLSVVSTFEPLSESQQPSSIGGVSSSGGYPNGHYRKSSANAAKASLSRIILSLESNALKQVLTNWT